MDENAPYRDLFFSYAAFLLVVRSGFCKSMDAGGRKIIRGGGEVKYLWNLFLLYCFWSGVMYVFKGLFSGVVNAEYRENFLYCLLFAPVGPYWYLITLLYYYLLGFGLLKILREKSETGKKLLFAILVFHGKPDVTVWISAVLSSVFLLGRNFFI